MAKAKVTKRVTKSRKPAAPKLRPVLVTTEFRGVFFGYATDTTGDTSSKVGPAADIELRKITCVAEVTERARAAFESAPWA